MMVDPIDFDLPDPDCDGPMDLGALALLVLLLLALLVLLLWVIIGTVVYVAWKLFV
jgi:hypothetical protein